jgi:peptidoglycan-binding protein ArfA
MPSSEDPRAVVGWRTVSKFYRRPPGLGWLLSLVAIPLLLAAIGHGVWSKSKTEVSAPSVKPPSVSVTQSGVSLTPPTITGPGLSFAPLSMTRNGNDLNLSGDLPDAATKASLLNALTGVLGPGVNLVDNLNIKPGVSAPDFSGLGPVFKAAANIPNFNFKLGGDTITLTGTAGSEDDKAAVEAAANAGWPNLRISNEIALKPVGPTGAPQSTTPAPECANLRTDVSGLLSTPINFDTNEYTLSASTQQLLSQIANKLKACPGSTVTVSGYTDNVGNDAINIPLSENRAKAVADYLVSQGVASDHVTTKGLAAHDPVASNETPEGRAQNRRVVIVVS